MIRRHFVAAVLATMILSASITFQACTAPAWFTTAEGIAEVAVPIVGSIVDIVDPPLAPAVTVVENGFSALVNTLTTYQKQPTATNLQAVEAAFTAIQTNEAQLESAAGIKNAGTDTTINAVITLLGQSITEIAALIPAQAPVNASLLQLSRAARTKAHGLKKRDIEKQFNAAVKSDPRFHGKTFHTGLFSRL